MNGPFDHTAERDALRLEVYKNGYFPVPVLGAWMGEKGAGKRPTMLKWQTVCAQAGPSVISTYSSKYPRDVNTGLLCGRLTPIDVDVLNEEVVNKIVQLAETMLGVTPLRRTGRAPKTLLCYRVHWSFNKKSTPELFFEDGSKGHVEILGEGNQFVGFGIHGETHEPYRWDNGRDPSNTTFDKIPLVDAADLHAFLVEAEKLIREAGGLTRSERMRERMEERAEAQNASRERQGRKAGGFRHDEKPDRALIAEALNHIPGDMHYDDWVRIGAAIYDGLGESGRDIWEDWSSKSSKNDPPFTARKWPSFAKISKVKIGTLFWYAKQNGWKRRPRHRMFAEATQAENNEETDSQKPTIRLAGGNLPHVVSAAEDALVAADLGLYQRGSLVVSPTFAQVSISHNRSTMATRIVPVRRHRVAEMMMRAANFESFDARSESWVPADCPLNVADTYLAREGHWRLPTLAGIVNCPTLRPDGSVLDRQGYDTATGLLYQNTDGVEFSSVIAQPTKDQAREALEFLLKLISTFPFVEEADRAVAISAILTAVIRRSLPTAPLHGFTAPSPGTGKSMLIDLASMICDGREAAVISAGSSAEESEKRLGAALIAGDAVIAIDNIERPLGGELFCQALTQRQLKVRILGLSVLAEVPTNCSIFANGNNLIFEGDIVRRALLASLDAKVERPELRKFDQNPIEMIRVDRDGYVNAALTVLRAFHVAGRPRQSDPLGSFEDWSRWVRDAIIWLGLEDPCVTMEKMRAADPKLARMVAVITQWQSAIGFDRVSVKGLIDKATAQTQATPDNHGNWTREYLHSEFREALLTVAGDGSQVNSRRLGQWLGLHKDRPVGGVRIVGAGMLHGVAQWQLHAAEATRQSAKAPRF